LTEGGDITAPTSTSTGAGNVCSLGSYTGTIWPSLAAGTTLCTYGTMTCTSANQATCTAVTITCGAGNIVCNYNTGACL
jgi:hypothetical protein